jgi:hypothetical protein
MVARTAIVSGCTQIKVTPSILLPTTKGAHCPWWLYWKALDQLCHQNVP